MRNGIEIWVENDRLNKIKGILDRGIVRFMEIDGQYVNCADVSGIFTPAYMEDRTRRKNGEWQCKSERWHMRGEKCQHHGKEYEDLQEEGRRLEAEGRPIDHILEKLKTVQKL